MNKTLFIIVEGETEQTALPILLDPHFRMMKVRLQCIRIGERRSNPGGGRFNLPEFNQHVARLARTHKGCFVSTCFDYYALGNGWPDYEAIRSKKLDKYVEIRELEEALTEAVRQIHPGVLWDNHFIPHIQPHEFETLLFSQPEILAGLLDDAGLADAMKNTIKEAGHNCEFINDNYDTCPSRRLHALTEGRYTKGRSGSAQAPTFMQKADLAVVREKCRHFNAWLEALETRLMQ